MIPKRNITVSNNKPTNAVAFKKYVESGVWQCPKDSAHRWIPFEGNTWICTKCENTTEFPCESYDYDDRMSNAMYWDSCRDVDKLFSYSAW